MDSYRFTLFLALGLILILIWQAWEEEQTKKTPAQTAAAVPELGPPAGREVPSAPAEVTSAGAHGGGGTGTEAATPTAQASPLARGTRVRVVTDLVEAVIDTEGGDLRELYLRRYPVSVDKPDVPFQLMADEGPEIFVAQSGLIGHASAYPTHKVRYETARTRYTLDEGQETLRVPLTWKGPDGVLYTKTYVFHRGHYLIDVEFHVANRTKHEWVGYLYGQLQRRHLNRNGWLVTELAFTGGAIYTPEDKFQKISFDEMAEKPLKREVRGGWVAMLQHYFVAAWMPAADARSEFYTDGYTDGRRVIGYKGLEPLRVAPGAEGVLRARLYAGPKEQKRLETLAEGMVLTVDYGMLTFLSAPLFWLLDHIHRWVGNWGWAIVILTLLIKLAFYPLSAASYRSMAQMKKVQPKLEELKQRYANDREKLNQALMELYRTEKINPLGGCLPILIQIPVFIALYWVLLESVEMRQAPWILWIKDLSTPDPYYVLPIVMGATMYLQQFISPQPADPIQRRMFLAMPAVFTVFFLFFPSGLVLYWTVNNLLSIAQQWHITRVMEGKKR
jgi:YidC/Oxa1 family membrane protein insertase